MKVEVNARHVKTGGEVKHSLRSSKAADMWHSIESHYWLLCQLVEGLDNLRVICHKLLVIVAEVQELPKLLPILGAGKADTAVILSGSG